MTSPSCPGQLIQNHPDIRTYTTIWMDTLRDGTFQLANTNKLIRFYEGATGLKTGSTDAALLLCLRHRGKGRDGAHRRGAGLPHLCGPI